MLIKNEKGEVIKVDQTPYDVETLIKREAEIQTYLDTTEAPRIKTVPDDETLKFFNTHINAQIREREELQNSQARLQILIKETEDAPVAKVEIKATDDVVVP